MLLSNYTTNIPHPSGGKIWNVIIKLNNKSPSSWRWKSVNCYYQIKQQISLTLAVDKCIMFYQNWLRCLTLCVSQSWINLFYYTLYILFNKHNRNTIFSHNLHYTDSKFRGSNFTTASGLTKIYQIQVRWLTLYLSHSSPFFASHLYILVTMSNTSCQSIVSQFIMLYLTHFLSDFPHSGGGKMQNITIKLYNKATSPWWWKNINFFIRFPSLWRWKNAKYYYQIIQQSYLTLVVEKYKMFLSNYTSNLPQPDGGKV